MQSRYRRHSMSTPLTTSSVRTAPLRIFLVEDSALVRELILESLADMPGVDVVGFAAGESDAFAQLNANPCDVVILDIALREGNGIQLLRRLATEPSQAESVRIVFSNNVSDAYRRVVEPLGVRFFFDKTTQFSDLQAVIEQLSNGGSGNDIGG